MSWIISISLILISISRYWFLDRYDFWWHKWTMILIAGALLLSFKIYKRFTLSTSLLSAWILISGIIVFSSMDNQYLYMIAKAKNDWVLIRYYAAFGIFCFLSIILITMYVLKHSETLFNIIAGLCFANSVYVIFQWASGADFLNRYGFFGNGSINASLIAFTFPILYDRIKDKIEIYQRIIVLLIPVIAIFCTMTSIPVGVLAVSLGSLILLNAKKKYRFVFIGLILSLFAAGYLIDPAHFLSDSKRFDMYSLVWNFYKEYLPLFTGSGTGTFPYLGPLVQIRNKFALGEWYVWLHNDWQQLLFENGILGLLLSLWVFAETIYRSIKQDRYYLTACVLSYGACMVFNYPLHYAVHSFIGCLLCAEILRRDYVRHDGSI